MRHQKAGLKLNRTSSHRNAMFRNMVTSLFKYDRIRTTDKKAKELRRWADNLITLAKRGDLHARRQAMSIIREKEVVHKLFEQAQERFGSKSGGYTRVIRLGTRPGDAAPVSLIELITEQPKKKRSRKKKAATAEKKVKTPESKPAEEKPEAAPEPVAETAPTAENKAAEPTEADVPAEAEETAKDKKEKE